MFLIFESEGTIPPARPPKKLLRKTKAGGISAFGLKLLPYEIKGVFWHRGDGGN
jgi:hypothetical protein